MEYVYAAMLLHKAGKEITENAVKKILVAAEVDANDAKIKALVAALEGVNIEEAIKKQVAAAPIASVASVTQTTEVKKEEKKEEKKEDNVGAAGLGALFG